MEISDTDLLDALDAMQQLPWRHREVLRLSLLGYEQADIAKMLGYKQADYIRELKTAALKKLAKLDKLR